MSVTRGRFATAETQAAGLNKPFARIRFDFVILKEAASAPSTIVEREHAGRRLSCQRMPFRQGFDRVGVTSTAG